MKWRRRLRQQPLGGVDAKVRSQRSDRHRRVQKNNGRRMKFYPAARANKDSRGPSCSLLVQTSRTDLLPFDPSMQSNLHRASPSFAAAKQSNTNQLVPNILNCYRGDNRLSTRHSCFSINSNENLGFAFTLISVKPNARRAAHRSSALFHFHQWGPKAEV